MREPLLHRAARAAAVAACVAVAACGGDRDAGTTDDTARGGLIDTAPASVASAVAAALTDENVFALLDTTYGAVLVLDTIAANKATAPEVKSFVTREISEHNLLRRGARDMIDRLGVSPALPDRDPIKRFPDAIADLRAKTGAEFDRAYVDHVLRMQEELLDEVNEALASRTTDAVRTFLEQTKANLENDVKGLRELKGRLG
jgi:putative membrane protein